MFFCSFSTSSSSTFSVQYEKLIRFISTMISKIEYCSTYSYRKSPLFCTCNVHQSITTCLVLNSMRLQLIIVTMYHFGWWLCFYSYTAVTTIVIIIITIFLARNQKKNLCCDAHLSSYNTQLFWAHTYVAHYLWVWLWSFVTISNHSIQMIFQIIESWNKLAAI